MKPCDKNKETIEQWVPEVGDTCVYHDDDGSGASTASGYKIMDGEEVSVLALFTNGNEYEMAVIEGDNFACTCVCIEWLKPLPTEEDWAVEELFSVMRDTDVAITEKHGETLARALYRAGHYNGYRKQPQPADDMADPANWRAGDWVVCVNSHIGFTPGIFYELANWESGRVLDVDGDCITVKEDDAGDDYYAPVAKFRFHYRP